MLEQSSIQPLYLPVGTGAAPEFRIGINSSNVAPYRGGIDDVRIYHTVLTPAQVLQLKQSSQLLPANTGTKRVDQYYDAFNRWVGSRVDGDGNVNTPEDQQRKWFVYDGSQVAAQFEPTPTNGPAVTHRYFWGLGVDELLADEKITYSGSQGTGNTAWALSDHLGTVRDLIDNNGVVRRHSSYDSFGQVQSEQFFSSTGSVMAATDPAAIDTLFGYTGRAYDDATGLQNNLHRWYDAGVGRWASEDPIGFGGGDTNLYRYVGNGSTQATDPSGLEEFRTEVLRTEGVVNGRSGAFYQDHKYKWNYFWGVWPYWETTGYGPRTFVPDTINGVPDLCGAGSQGAKIKLNRIANAADAGVTYTKAGVIIGSLALPGPEDAIWAGLMSKYGLRLGAEGLTVLGRKLSGALVDDAAALVARESGETLVQIAHRLTAADLELMRLGGPKFDMLKIQNKIGQKLNQLRKLYPEVRRAAEGGCEDAVKAAQFRVQMGGGRRGAPVSQDDAFGIYYEDGPVTWVFGPDGYFRSMRSNRGWAPK